MTKDELKKQVYAAIDRRADEIIGLGEQIRRTPELGFKEFKTAKLVEETLAKIGLSPKGGSRDHRRAGGPAGAGGGWPDVRDARRARRPGPSPDIPKPIRPRAPRMPAGTTRRWPGCSARRWD
jgi:hypothetical protein